MRMRKMAEIIRQLYRFVADRIPQNDPFSADRLHFKHIAVI